MQNNKTIRKASLDDLKQIYLIEKDVFSNEHWTLEMVESELKNFLGKTTWIIEESTVILGYCMMRIFCNEANIINMAIKSSRQREGLGSFLLGHVLNQLPINSSVFLEVKEGNLSAINLYQRLGFKVINMRKNYYKDGRTAQDDIVAGSFPVTTPNVNITATPSDSSGDTPSTGTSFGSDPASQQEAMEDAAGVGGGVQSGYSTDYGGSVGYEDPSGEAMVAKGGFMGKKTLAQQMKRSGLASKK